MDSVAAGGAVVAIVDIGGGGGGAETIVGELQPSATKATEKNVPEVRMFRVYSRNAALVHRFVYECSGSRDVGVGLAFFRGA